MPKIKRPSVRGKRGYDYLGRFKQDKYLRAGHNWAWLSALGGAASKSGIVSSLLSSGGRGKPEVPDYEREAEEKPRALGKVATGLGRMRGTKQQPADVLEFARGAKQAYQGIREMLDKEDD